MKAAVFHIHLNDMISSRKITVGGNTVAQSYNAAEYKNTGVELSYSVQANDQLSWYVGGIFGNPKKKKYGSFHLERNIQPLAVIHRCGMER